MTTATTQPSRRRFTTEEYHQLGDAGILGPDERVELMDGEIIAMPPIREKHNAAGYDLTDLLTERLRRSARIAVLGPLHLREGYEPQPDIMLLRRRPDRYWTGLPVPEDVLLLIEVADTTLSYDRTTKAASYAQAEIRDYWIAELTNERLLIFRNPAADGYEVIQVARPGETVSPLALPDLSFAVSDLLGLTPA